MYLSVRAAWLFYHRIDTRSLLDAEGLSWWIGLPWDSKATTARNTSVSYIAVNVLR